MWCNVVIDGRRYKCNMRKVRFLSQLEKGERLLVSDPVWGAPEIVRVSEAIYGYVAVWPLFCLRRGRWWFLRKADLIKGIYIIDEIEML